MQEGGNGLRDSWGVWTQVVREAAREGAPLDLLFAIREGPVGDMMVGGLFGHSHHEAIGFFHLWRSKEGSLQNRCRGFPEGRHWPV